MARTLASHTVLLVLLQLHLAFGHLMDGQGHGLFVQRDTGILSGAGDLARPLSPQR